MIRRSSILLIFTFILFCIPFIATAATSSGFIYDGTNYIALSPSGATWSAARGINDYGNIVGSYNTATAGYGYIYDGTSYNNIQYPGAVVTQAYGINNSGTIIGSYGNLLNYSPKHGFLYNGTTFTSIDYPGATNTFLYDINDSGTILGGAYFGAGLISSFLYDGTTFTTLGLPSSYLAVRFNNSGQIVGQIGNTGLAFLKDGDTYTTIQYSGRNPFFS